MKIVSYLSVTTTQEIQELQAFLRIIAQENKFKIIMHLMKGEECVCTIAEKLNLEQSLVSHHINDLRETGVVNTRKVETWVHCSLNQAALRKLEELYSQYLGYKNISGKMCDLHEACQCLIKENL